jgi:hypothetical protein
LVRVIFFQWEFEKKMTTYSFYLEMQDLCERVAVAFRTVKKTDVLLPKVYLAAAVGFHKKGEELTAGKSEETLSKPLYNRLKTFRKWVEDYEAQAAKMRA